MVRVDREILLEAARALTLAGHYRLALRLIDGARADQPADRVPLAMAAAEIAADSGWFVAEALPADGYAARAAEVLADRDDPIAAWDLRLLNLRQEYLSVLFHHGEPDGLAATALALRNSAPDERRRGWAAFWAGVIADNISAAPAVAGPLYREALSIADAVGDDLLASYAHRHLAGHEHDAGELALARERAWRSAELRERVGFIPGVLAQRLTLADVLLDSGERAEAATQARDVARAAGARGWTRLVDHANELLARADAKPRDDVSPGA